MKEIYFIYKVENIKNGNTIFTTNPTIAERLSRDGYRVTCKNYMVVNKISCQSRMTGGY